MFGSVLLNGRTNLLGFRPDLLRLSCYAHIRFAANSWSCIHHCAYGQIVDFDSLLVFLQEAISLIAIGAASHCFQVSVETLRPTTRKVPSWDLGRIQDESGARGDPRYW